MVPDNLIPMPQSRRLICCCSSSTTQRLGESDTLFYSKAKSSYSCPGVPVWPHDRPRKKKDNNASERNPGRISSVANSLDAAKGDWLRARTRWRSYVEGYSDVTVLTTASSA